MYVSESGHLSKGTFAFFFFKVGDLRFRIQEDPRGSKRIQEDPRGSERIRDLRFMFCVLRS